MNEMWANDYVGLPFAECDCWGLARRVYARERGIELPTYERDYSDPEDQAQVCRTIGEELDGPSPWRPVPAGEEGDFDLALIALGGLPTHIGLLAAGGRFILHSLPQAGAVLERRDSPRLAASLRGFYRYDASALAAQCEPPLDEFYDQT